VLRSQKKEITKTDSIDKLLPLEGLTALFNAAGFFISLFISLLIAYISSLSMGVFFTGSGMVVSILEDFALLFVCLKDIRAFDKTAFRPVFA
jgi:hypothetical protein